jgi:hypothetical protein
LISPACSKFRACSVHGPDSLFMLNCYRRQLASRGVFGSVAAASVSSATTGRSCSLLEFPGQDLVVPLLWLPPAVEAAPFVFSVCKAWSFDVLACQGFDLVAFLVQNFSSSWPFLVVHARCSMKGF